MKFAITGFFVCIMLSATAFGVEIKPGNFSLSGGTVSFDFIVTSPPANQAASAQLTIGSISGPGTLTLNTDASEAVKNDSGYWINGNSTGAAAIDNGDGSYQFGDSPDNPALAIIDTGDKIARFAFTWDGTAGDYVFTLDRSTTHSFIQLDNFSNAAITLPAGVWFSDPIISADDSSFTAHIVPEPATIILTGLGGLALLRKRKA